MADALLYLSSKEFVKENIFEYLSRKDIAEFASITTENAIRILKSFEKEGIITLTSKHIKVINCEQLQYICQIGWFALLVFSGPHSKAINRSRLF